MRAIILAGGENKRIGANKAFLKLGGQFLIERIIAGLKKCNIFENIIIVTDNPSDYKELGLELIKDSLGLKSPLKGIWEGLKKSSHSYNFVIGCDMPFVNIALIEHMAGLCERVDIVIPRYNKDLEPLHAFYSKGCVPFIEERLKKGDLKVRSFFDEVRVRYVEEKILREYDPNFKAFFNINTEEDLRRAEQVV